MPNPDRLVKRGATWYYRRRVPTELVPIIGRKEVKFSLKTVKKAEALKFRPFADQEWDQRFDEARQTLEQSNTTAEPISYDEAVSRIRSRVDNAVARLLKNRSSHVGDISNEQLRENQIDNEQRLHDLGYLTDRGAVEVAISLRQMFGSALDHLPENQRDDIFEYLRQAEIEITKRLLAANKGDFSKHLNAPSSAPDASVPQLSARLFGDLAEAYLANYKTESAAQGISQKRIDAVSRQVDLVKEIIGPNEPVSTVTYARCQEARNTLAKLPTNMTKHYPGATIDQAIARAEREGRATLSRERQSAILDTLSSVLEYGVKDRVLSFNPSSDLKPLGRTVAPEDRRRPFATEQLKAIFNAPIFTGCRDDQHGFAKPGDNHPRRARFWVPLICLFHGMRPNEICQMHVSDVRKTELGRFYFGASTSAPDQKLKTETSRRNIPFHPEIIKIGFEDYLLGKKKDGTERLFPELKTDKYGYYSAGISDWFTASFLPKYIKKSPGLSLYSFRHNFRDALRRIEPPSGVLEQLGGWKQNKTTSDKAYGDGYTPDHLAKYIDAVEYPGLDLSHLHVE